MSRAIYRDPLVYVGDNEFTGTLTTERVDNDEIALHVYRPEDQDIHLYLTVDDAAHLGQLLFEARGSEPV